MSRRPPQPLSLLALPVQKTVSNGILQRRDRPRLPRSGCSLCGWEQNHTIDDLDFVLTLVNRRLLGVVQVLTSDVTQGPVPSPQLALDDFMRGMRDKAKATDGFDPPPLRYAASPRSRPFTRHNHPTGVERHGTCRGRAQRTGDALGNSARAGLRT